MRAKESSAQTLAETFRTYLLQSPFSTEREFAKAVGVSQATASRWLQGRSIPDDTNLKKAILALAIPADRLPEVDRSRSPTRRRGSTAVQSDHTPEPPLSEAQFQFRAAALERMALGAFADDDEWARIARFGLVMYGIKLT